VERKSKDDPIFDERKVKNNAIDYRLPIDTIVSTLTPALICVIN